MGTRAPVVVVDNASSDGTLAILSGYSQFEVIRLSRNIGAAARDVGVRRLATEYLLGGKAIAGFMAGACVLRRSAYLGVGGDDKRVFLGAEEETLADKLLLRLLAVPRVIRERSPMSTELDDRLSVLDRHGLAHGRAIPRRAALRPSPRARDRRAPRPDRQADYAGSRG
ncbi:MAG: hypothetical protein QOI26_1105 [Pseudonocardiales bacterium]|jgi:hypothetical protein|nr:hypothetical protein [Pseudonocardiales bacterium]